MKASFWHRTRRRPSFWLGLFVACFLAWAWWDSMHASLGINSVVANRRLILVRVEGATQIFWRLAPGTKLRFEAARLPPEVGGEYISVFKEEGFSYFRVPDSLVFFSFVGVWVGWLAWRWRVEQNTLTA